MSQFTDDLAIGRRGELIALDVLSKLYKQCEFIDIARDKDFYYIGDIKVINKQSGNERFIEVKNDSRIADTHNVLCEDEYFNKYDGEFYKGNMHNCGTWLYCVVSEQERKIYTFDYAALQAIYRKGEFKRIKHETQDTYAYLLPIGTLARKGILLETINY
jgi:hypothetical protein